MTGDAGLVVRQIEAGYGASSVLHGVDLSVAPGELVALIGANGAGKSTLLKCISGLLHLTRGDVQMGGASLVRKSPLAIVQLGVAHVPERRQIFGDLTVRDNLVLGAYSALRHLSQRELQGRVDGVLELFPALRERLPERASHLSGGQQQMLAIARGLMLQPRLLLLDEPSLGLAPALVQEIFTTLSRLRSNNVGLLLVEQNARMSLRIADRGYVIETGRVVLSGTGRELVDMPEVVQRYLGGAADGTRDAQAADVAAVGARLRAALVPPGR